MRAMSCCYRLEQKCLQNKVDKAEYKPLFLRIVNTSSGRDGDWLQMKAQEQQGNINEHKNGYFFCCCFKLKLACIIFVVTWGKF